MDLICEYSLCNTKGTCLVEYQGRIIDRRGYDPNKCLLRKKGPAVGRQAMEVRAGGKSKG